LDPKVIAPALHFIAQQRLDPDEYAYRYSPACQQATLYSTCYAVLARHLLGDLETLSRNERAEWSATINRFQDEDGLYRDPVIYDQGWYAGDPLWCGRAHLTCHVVTALACLGGTAPKPLAWLAPWKNEGNLLHWLEERDWGDRVGWSGNEIMNVGSLLQYARDFQADAQAGRAVEVLLAWLSSHHLNRENGVWGDRPTADPLWRSHAVQAAYHWWPLFFYDRLPVPCLERAIDTVLDTQNPLGGFGWGVHNPSEPFMSSACEDIDSIDPLCRMSMLSSYRRAEIQAALQRAKIWVTGQQAEDGGFVFMRGAAFEYGHPQLTSAAGQGALFPTWFRLLSLALIDRALPAQSGQLSRVNFVRCPGMQFWNTEDTL
jgi:hypothetical protein